MVTVMEVQVTVRAAYKVNDEAAIRNKSLTKAQLRRAMGSLDKQQAVYGLYVSGECVCTLRLVLTDVSNAQLQLHNSLGEWYRDGEKIFHTSD